MEEFEFIVSQEDVGQRLDRFLCEKLSDLQPGFSRTRVKALMDEGNILNAKTGDVLNNCSSKTKNQERFLVKIPALKTSEILPQEVHFDIVFEDDDLLVINKPAGLITHPGNGRHDQTLVNGLLFKIGDSLSGINGVMRPGIVHRLDKDTSGLMVVAKNDFAHKNLAAQIEDRSLKRNYLALCYGIPKPLSGRIQNNIDRSNKNRLKMAVVKSGGRHAITNYEVKKIYLNGALSLVECRLDTGRTHQIRVHMNEVGHSLVGDQLYCNKRKYLSNVSQELQILINKFPRQFLHSYKIAFTHPQSKKEMEFEIPLPEDLENLKSIISAE